MTNNERDRDYQDGEGGPSKFRVNMWEHFAAGVINAAFPGEVVVEDIHVYGSEPTSYPEDSLFPTFVRALVGVDRALEEIIPNEDVREAHVHEALRRTFRARLGDQIISGARIGKFKLN